MSNLFENHWGNSRRQYGFWDDLTEFVSGDLLTSIEGDSGASTANIDAAGGQCTLTSGTVDNNEVYLHTTKELFLFANNKPCEVMIRLAFAEGATNVSNVAMGFMDAVAAQALVDNGAGPKVSGTHALFFKEDGQTLWSVQTSLGTLQTTTQLTTANSLDRIAKTAAGGASTFRDYRILVQPTSSTRADASFFIQEGGATGDSAAKEVLVFKQEFVYTSAVEMDVFVGLKAGSSTDEVVTVDYIAARQLR